MPICRRHVDAFWAIDPHERWYGLVDDGSDERGDVMSYVYLRQDTPVAVFATHVTPQALMGP